MEHDQYIQNHDNERAARRRCSVPHPSGAPVCFGSEGDGSPPRRDPRPPAWGPEQNKEIEREETKEPQMAAVLRGEEQESMQEVRRGGGSRGPAAPAQLQAAAKRPWARPAALAAIAVPAHRSSRPVPSHGVVARQPHGCRQHPAGPAMSRQRAAQAVAAPPRLYMGGFKRLLRVSEGGTHAGWRAGEPLILDQSQCPSLIRPWRGNEK